MVEDPKCVRTDAVTSLPVTIHNDTFLLKPHATGELSSAAHTLPIATTPEPFHNSTDKVSKTATN